MANYTLTPEKKAEMKKAVLDEVNKHTKKKRPTLKAKAPSASSADRKKPSLPKKKIPTPVTTKVTATSELKKQLESAVNATEKKVVKKKTVKKKVVARKTTAKKKVAKKSKTTPKTSSVFVLDTSAPIKPVKTSSVKLPKVVKPQVTTPKKLVKKITESNELLKAKDSKVNLSEKKPKNKPMFWLGSIVFIILMIIVSIMVNIWGIYNLKWDGKFSYITSSVFSLPAGSVNGQKIKMTDYLDDAKVIKYLSTDNTTTVDYREEAFNRLVSLVIVSQELKKYNQSVTAEMLNTEFENIISEFTTPEEAKSEIMNKYGMSMEEFKYRVLKPIVEIDLLKSIAIKDDALDINRELEKTAQEALSIAIAGSDNVDFNELSLQFTNDPNVAKTKGEMGWFVRGELPQDVEPVLFSLDSGQVYNKLVKDESGYRIFKVDAKVVDEDTGQESIKLSQIVLLSNTEMYFKSLFDKAEIKNYLK